MTKRSNRWTLIALMAVFVAPMLVAMYLNSRWSNWHPGATRNYGTLIEPVLPLRGVALPAPGAGEPRWTLLSLNCRTDCATRLDELARLRRGLGLHEDKLVVAALGAPGPVPAGLAVLDDPQRAVAAALASRALPARGLYLIDPLGNLMMRYPDDYAATGVIDDLERLLKYSKFAPR